jgi:hypothetical protein
MPAFSRQEEEYRKLASRFRDEEARRKLEWTASATVSLHQYRGIFHTRHRPGDTSYEVDQALVGGVLPIAVQPRITDLAVSTMMSQPSNWYAVQTGPDKEDYYAAQGKTLQIRDHDSRNAVHTINVRLARSLFLTAAAFKQLWLEDAPVAVELPPATLEMWLKMKSDFLKKPVEIIGEPQQVSGGNVRIYTPQPVTREEFVSPFSVLMQTGARDLDSCTQFCVVEMRPIDWVRQQNFNRVDESELARLRGDSIADRKNLAGQSTGIGLGGYYGGQSQVTGDQFGTDARVVRVANNWIKVGARSWLQLVTVGDYDRFLVHFDEKPYHTYIDYHANQVDDYAWGASIAARIQPIQHTINRANTDLYENFHSLMKDTILAAPSARKSLSNHFGQVILVNSKMGDKVSRLEMPTNTHQALQGMVNMGIQQAYGIAGLGDASRGDIQTHQSAQAIQSAQRADAGPLQLIRTVTIDAGEQRKYKKVLQMQAAVFDEPRWIACAGSNLGPPLSRMVRRSDLQGSTDVALHDSVSLPRGAAERLQLVTEWARGGLFMPGNEGVLEKMRNFARVETDLIPEPTEERIEEERALREGEWVAAGMVYAPPQAMVPGASPQLIPVLCIDPTSPLYLSPLLQATDIHNIHIKQHSNDLRSGKFDHDPALKATMLRHLQEHQNAQMQIEAEQMAKQLEMEANMSIAQQAGQQALQTTAALLEQPTPTVKPTAADGGKKSGEVRRGEKPKK